MKLFNKVMLLIAVWVFALVVTVGFTSPTTAPQNSVSASSVVRDKTQPVNFNSAADFVSTPQIFTAGDNQNLLLLQSDSMFTAFTGNSLKTKNLPERMPTRNDRFKFTEPPFNGADFKPDIQARQNSTIYNRWNDNFPVKQ